MKEDVSLFNPMKAIISVMIGALVVDIVSKFKLKYTNRIPSSMKRKLCARNPRRYKMMQVKGSCRVSDGWEFNV